jgi:(heptosyl)LPS beta-1,4-glucosyltransferase
MTTKPTLGVVAISYNEEIDLPGFLEHLVTWVDEIVIVDDGSTDSTEQIASNYGSKVKFIRSKRVKGEYYSDQRNKGIDNANSDWLLHMDIDERVTK